MGFVLWPGTAVSIWQILIFTGIVVLGVMGIRAERKGFNASFLGAVFALVTFIGSYLLPGISVLALNGHHEIHGYGFYNGLLNRGRFEDFKQSDGYSGGESAYEWPNGDRYIGEWMDGNRTGKGEWTTAQYKYEGNFSNNEFWGEGIRTDLQTGEKIMGYWKSYKQSAISYRRLENGSWELEYMLGFTSDHKEKMSRIAEQYGISLNGMGKFSLYREDGTLLARREGTFVDGRIDGKGKEIIYNQYGGLLARKEGTFVNGELKGAGKESIYNQDGTLKETQDTVF